MQEREITDLVMAGLATDFCVNYSAVDAARLGFTVRVVEDACRAIDLDGSLAVAKQEMSQNNVTFINSADLSG